MFVIRIEASSDLNAEIRNIRSVQRISIHVQNSVDEGLEFSSAEEDGAEIAPRRNLEGVLVSRILVAHLSVVSQNDFKVSVLSLRSHIQSDDRSRRQLQFDRVPHPGEAGAVLLRIQQGEEDAALEGVGLLEHQRGFRLAHDGLADRVG